MSRLLFAPFAFYVLATAVGLVLRLGFVLPIEVPSYSNALHAHSHTLFFGWGALGIFALAFHLLGAKGKQHGLVLGSIAAISAASFVSFLQGGYSVPSIVLSTLSLGLWAWVVSVTFRTIRGKSGLDLAFLRTGLVYLVFACVGAVMRVVLIATAASAHAKSLAVYAFLHAFGWFFVFSVLGLLLRRARAHGVRLDERLFRLQLRLAAPIAWLAFPLGVAGGTRGALGTLACVASALLVVPLGIGAFALYRASRDAQPGLRGSLRWLSFWMSLVAFSSLGGGFGLSELAVSSRHFAILYLHILLAGFVSYGLITVFFSALGARLAWASGLHNGGLLVMVSGLALAGLTVLGYSQSHAVAYTGALFAAIGGALIFAAGVGFAWQAWRALHRVDLPVELSPMHPRLEPHAG